MHTTQGERGQNLVFNNSQILNLTLSPNPNKKKKKNVCGCENTWGERIEILRTALKIPLYVFASIVSCPRTTSNMHQSSVINALWVISSHFYVDSNMIYALKFGTFLKEIVIGGHKRGRRRWESGNGRVGVESWEEKGTNFLCCVLVFDSLRSREGWGVAHWPVTTSLMVKRWSETVKCLKDKDKKEDKVNK
jgi:hypothetical protein